MLATIGATAPFVGLFGTVWGIMNSFIGISASQTTNLAVVAPGAGDMAGEPAGRVLRHPLTRKGLVQLRLCTPEGGVRDEIVSKRQGERYRRARETGWGDTFT